MSSDNPACVKGRDAQHRDFRPLAHVGARVGQCRGERSTYTDSTAPANKRTRSASEQTACRRRPRWRVASTGSERDRAVMYRFGQAQHAEICSSTSGIARSEPGQSSQQRVRESAEAQPARPARGFDDRAVGQSRLSGGEHRAGELARGGLECHLLRAVRWQGRVFRGRLPGRRRARARRNAAGGGDGDLGERLVAGRPDRAGQPPERRAARPRRRPRAVHRVDGRGAAYARGAQARARRIRCAGPRLPRQHARGRQHAGPARHGAGRSGPQHRLPLSAHQRRGSAAPARG